jgi:rod shape determining protein RodA
LSFTTCLSGKKHLSVATKEHKKRPKKSKGLSKKSPLLFLKYTQKYTSNTLCAKLITEYNQKRYQGFFVQLLSYEKYPHLNHILTLFISLIGLLFVFSATYSSEKIFSIFFEKQALGLLIGAGIYIACFVSDYRTLCRYGYFLFFFSLFLLIATSIKGSIGLGARRWINLGFIKFQPSELIKLFLPPFVVYYLYTENENGQFKFSDFWLILGFLGFTCLLVMKQPDLGTAIVIGTCGLIILWLSGIGKKFFILGFLFLSVSMPIAYKSLKPYQRRRIEVFLGAGDAQNERYQIEQSKIAIGSGGFFGKGILRGTQTQLSFLPESRTDFIFSVLCEEAGFLGAVILLFLYALLALRLLLGIMAIKSFFAQLLGIGLIAPLLVSIVVNIGMVIGILPIVGIPLPLMSYGLTHTCMTLAALGWINGIIRHYQP